jgi:uncharacterized protein YyaL (SSP411 family)
MHYCVTTTLLHTGSFSLNCSADTVEAALNEAKQLLYSARQHKPPPMLDDKVITAWNGLMISAFAKAGQAFSSNDYVLQAHTAALFLYDHLYDGDMLYRSWRYAHVQPSELYTLMFPFMLRSSVYAYCMSAYGVSTLLLFICINLCNAVLL